MVPQFMRRFLRSSTKPAASRNMPLRAVPTTASQFAPVGLGQNGGTACGQHGRGGSVYCAVTLAMT